MPQASYPYAVGRIKVLETRMLDKAKWARLKEADSSEALRLLADSGYGGGAQTGGDVEPLIRAELEAARQVILEVTPNEGLTSLFLLRTDAHNLKTLLKARVLGIDSGDLLAAGGSFPLETLQKCVAERDYSALPEAFSRVLRPMEEQLAQRVDPLALSAAVDRAVFEYAQDVLRGRKNRNPFIREYFTAQIDFINVQSAIRARALGWDTDKASPLLIPGGEIERRDLLESLDAPEEQLPRKLGRGAYGRAIAAAVEDYLQTHSTQALEQRMDAALMELARRYKYDSFGMGPIVGYLLGREAEAKALRVLFAAKRAGIDAALPELYA
ncbi:V-type ATPase subunit [Clostridiaceae bacterium NSJ-31]|uniref:V-type ATPase subunit n=1 Tax=Ligaoa zhengdingensis TaxID=2763658 RepID=A0A926DZ92_9FIRM|nr:V-type ATPase subunit [Ligaoa zhengdingensis]MBC8546537.1 V-type ATPase subunit [Ligaoa zhengdingensis]